MTVEQLVEQTAKKIWMDDTGSDIGWETSHERIHQSGSCFNIAKQILSHPDLALIDRGEEVDTRGGLFFAIQLSEVLEK